MVEICERNCDLETQPIIYVNRKEKGHTIWKRVKCDTCPLDKKESNVKLPNWITNFFSKKGCD